MASPEDQARENIDRKGVKSAFSSWGGLKGVFGSLCATNAAIALQMEAVLHQR